MNTEKILEGLRAAKTAFEETLYYCKEPFATCLSIYNFASHNGTVLGICYFLGSLGFEASEYFVKNVFGDDYLTPPIKYFKNKDEKYVKHCIGVTETRVEWLESKIKELEANQ